MKQHYADLCVLLLQPDGVQDDSLTSLLNETFPGLSISGQTQTQADLVLLATSLKKPTQTLLKPIAGQPFIVLLDGFTYASEQAWFHAGALDCLDLKTLSGDLLKRSVLLALQKDKNKSSTDQEMAFKELFHISPQAQFIYEGHTLAFLDVNTAACELYGYSREAFLKMSVRDIVPPSDLPRLEKLISEQKHTVATTLRARHLKKGGQEFTASVQSQPTRFLEKCAVLTVVSDITEQRKFEKALTTSEKRFKTLVRESGTMITVLDLEMRALYLSPNHAKVMGYDFSETKNARIADYIHPDDRAEFLRFLTELRNQKRLNAKPYRGLRQDGSWAWLETIGTNALKIPAVEGIVLNTRDITARMENERQLKEISDRYSAIAKATSDVVYELDYKTGEILLANPGHHSLFEYEFKENKTDLAFFDSCLHEDEIKEVKAFFAQSLLQPEQHHFVTEYRFRRKDGSYAYVQDRFQIHYENGEPSVKVGALQDISPRKFHEIIVGFEKELYELNANPQVPFQDILDKLLTNVGNMLRGAMFSVVMLQEDRIKYYSGKGLSPSFIDKIDGSMVNALQLSNGAAITQGNSIFTDNIPKDPLWKKYRSIAKQEGLQTCWSIPIKKVSGKVFACFDIYFKVSKKPSETEITLVERAARQLGVLLESRHASVENLRVQERYDIVSKATSDTIWDWNIIEDTFEWNRGIQGVFGYKREDVGTNSRWWFDRIHPEDSIKMSVKLYSFLEQKTEKWQDEYRFACADGTYKYVYDRAFLVKDADGKPIRMIGAMQDVSRQKQEEQRLKLLETVITQMKDSVIITESDRTGKKIPKIVFVNPAFTAMTGLESEEVIGKPPTVFLDKKAVKQEFKKMIQALKDRQEFKLETPNTKKTGEPYWINFSMIPITNNEGEHSHWISIQRDITEEKRQEKEKEHLIRELTQNNKDLKQFSYITSHNLRAPLSNLMGLLNLLEEMPFENEELKAIVNGLHKSTYLLNETISDLVKVVIIKDNPSIQKEEVLIKDVFENVFNQLSFLISLHRPFIKLQLERVSILNINKAYLESILLNLLTNAIKYRSEKRTLKIFISSKMVGDSISLVFRDNGIGIDLERHRDKIFGLYQRFHNYPDSKGLGLYLVKSQVESMGGTISVESTVDKGTTFTLTFKKQTT